MKEETDWDNDNTGDTSQSSLETKKNWTDIASIPNEDWGKELSSGGGSLSDWGTTSITEDWDAPGEPSFGANWTEQQVGEGVKNEQPVIGTIGSEVKSGKIPKKDANVCMGKTDSTVGGQFGAIGQPIVKDTVNELGKLKNTEIEKDTTVAKDPLYKDVIGNSTGNEVKEELLKTVKNSGPKSLDVSKLQGPKIASPKLTGWSGLDGFEPLPSYDSGSQPLPESGPSVDDSNKKLKPKAEECLPTNVKPVDHDIVASEAHKDIAVDKSTTETSPAGELETGRVSDEWGWTTASSKKAKVIDLMIYIMAVSVVYLYRRLVF